MEIASAKATDFDSEAVKIYEGVSPHVTLAEKKKGIIFYNRALALVKNYALNAPCLNGKNSNIHPLISSNSNIHILEY